MFGERSAAGDQGRIHRPDNDQINAIFDSAGLTAARGGGARTNALNQTANAGINTSLNNVFHALGVPGFATGGVVGGNGNPGVDSVPLIAMPDEFIMRGQGGLHQRHADAELHERHRARAEQRQWGGNVGYQRSARPANRRHLCRPQRCRVPRRLSGAVAKSRASMLRGFHAQSKTNRGLYLTSSVQSSGRPV